MSGQFSGLARAGILSLLMAPVAVQAVPLGDLTDPADTQPFDAITNNNPPDTQNLEDQLFVDIYGSETTGIGDNQVLFVFRNEGPIESSVQGVYFDDANGIVLSVNGLIDDDESTGIFTHNDGTVDYSVGGNPPDLPAGNTVGFSADWVFTADNPAPTQGINPGEVKSPPAKPGAYWVSASKAP